jgi:hypothetical protein
MLIERRSLVSGLIRTLDLPVTEEQIEAWENGALIQDAMPNLTSAHREFLLTGITDEEWEETFPPEAEGDKGNEEDAVDNEPAF